MFIVIIVTTSKKEFFILGDVEIKRGGKNILHSKINYLMPKCLMMERHFTWLRHLMYPCKYECVRDCVYECGMNESDCVC